MPVIFILRIKCAQGQTFAQMVCLNGLCTRLILDTVARNSYLSVLKFRGSSILLLLVRYSDIGILYSLLLYSLLFKLDLVVMPFGGLGYLLDMSLCIAQNVLLSYS